MAIAIPRMSGVTTASPDSKYFCSLSEKEAAVFDSGQKSAIEIFIREFHISSCSQHREDRRKMANSSKAKLDVYTDLSIQLIPEDTSVRAKAAKSKKTARKSRKESDRPVYLNRV